MNNKVLLITEKHNIDLKSKANGEYILEGIFAQFGVKNNNNRIYEEEAINKYLRKPRPTRTPEQNKNNADARRGKKRTPEQIASFTAWRKDEEKVKRVGDNISKALKGKKRSEKYKESRKGKKLNPESIKKREATKKKESRIN
jgi:hypothetical protein